MKTAFITAFLTIIVALALPLQAQVPAQTSATPPTDAALKISNGQSIAFLGDSITQFGWDYPGGYVRQVIAGFQSVGVTIKPVPAGVSGNTSVDMLKRLQNSVLNQKPTWMTLSCGVNDVWHKAVDLEAYKKNITSIVDQAQAAGIKVMILTATPIMEVADNDFNQRLAPYNDFLRQLAKDRNLPLVDMNAAYWSKLKATPPPPGTTLLTVDGVHPNPEGNALFARTILEAFGVTSGQVDQYEAQWRQSDDAAGLFLGVVTCNGATVPDAVYKNLLAAAKERKIPPEMLSAELSFKAMRNVLKTHDLKETLAPSQISSEINDDLAAQLNALPAASPAPPPSSTPAPPVRVNTGVYLDSTVGMSLALYKNLLAAARAQKLEIYPLADTLYFQALRTVVKTHEQDETLTVLQIRPEVNQAFLTLLKALPPTDSTAPVSPAPAVK